MSLSIKEASKTGRTRTVEKRHWEVIENAQQVMKMTLDKTESSTAEGFRTWVLEDFDAHQLTRYVELSAKWLTHQKTLGYLQDNSQVVLLFYLKQGRAGPREYPVCDLFRLYEVYGDEWGQVDSDKLASKVKDLSESENELFELNTAFHGIKYVIRTFSPGTRRYVPGASPVYTQKILLKDQTGSSCDSVVWKMTGGDCFYRAIVASLLYQWANDEVAVPVLGVNLGGLGRHATMRGTLDAKIKAVRKRLDRLTCVVDNDSYDEFMEFVIVSMNVRVHVFSETTLSLCRTYGRDLVSPLADVYVLESKAVLDDAAETTHWDVIPSLDVFEQRQCSVCHVLFKNMQKRERHGDRGCRANRIRFMGEEKCAVCTLVTDMSQHITKEKTRCSKCGQKCSLGMCLDTHQSRCTGVTCKYCFEKYTFEMSEAHMLDKCKGKLFWDPIQVEDDEDPDAVLSHTEVFDLETEHEGEKTRFTLWQAQFHALGTNETTTFRREELRTHDAIATSIMTYMRSRPKTTRYWAHNASGFDAHFIDWSAIQSVRPVSHFLMINGCRLKCLTLVWGFEYEFDPTFLDGAESKLELKMLKKVRRESIILDSMLIMSGSLQRVATSLGLPAQKEVFPYDWCDRRVYDLSWEGEVTLQMFNEKALLKKYEDAFGDVVPYDGQNWTGFTAEEKGELIELVRRIRSEFPKHRRFSRAEATTKYLTQDVQMLKQILLKIHDVSVKSYNHSALNCMTTGQYSLEVFRRHTMFPEDTISRLPARVHAFIVDCCVYGGRTEMFRAHYDVKANETISFIDITSSYPYAMTKPLPLKLLGYRRIEDDLVAEAEAFVLMQNPRLYLMGEGSQRRFTEVSLVMPSGRRNNPIPILPEKKNGKNMFTYQDKIKAGYCAEELLWAIEEEGWIVTHVYRWALFESSLALKPYVEWLYERKERWDKFKEYVDGKELDDTSLAKVDRLAFCFGGRKEDEDTRRTLLAAYQSQREFSKLVCNSFFGKFLQNPNYPKNERMSVKAYTDLTNDRMKHVKMFKRITHDSVLAEYSENRVITNNDLFLKNINAAVGATILAHGRMHITRVMRHHSDNVLYGDTDSVAFVYREDRPLLPDGMQIGPNLGDFTYETKPGQRIERFAAIAPKSYAMEGVGFKKTKAKGIPIGAMKMLDRETGLVQDVLSVDTYKSMWNAYAYDNEKQVYESKFKRMGIATKWMSPGVSTFNQTQRLMQVQMEHMKRAFRRDGTSRPYENGDDVTRSFVD